MNTAVSVRLWEGPAPGALGDRPEDIPSLDVYRPDPETATGAAMLILPGGAYTFLSEKSGRQYGLWLAANGITGFVVNFRLGSNGYRYAALLADAARALSVVRGRAADWEVDPVRVGVIGTSAGGHLAALMLTGATGERPALGVLCYPVISLVDPLAHQETRTNFLGDEAALTRAREQFSADLHLDEHTPPCFVWHTLADEEVSADNSLRFASALSAHGVPYELHLYEKGAHALGLAREQGLYWPEECVRWLRSHGF
jgi:acetyl esterase/lipase